MREMPSPSGFQCVRDLWLLRDKIDSDRAYSLENDDSGQSRSESEQEDGPDERWVENDQTARPKFLFFGPVPANVVLGPNENELDFFSTLLPCLSFWNNGQPNQLVCMAETTDMSWS